MLNKFLSHLDRVAVSSLPEGDIDMLHSQSYDIIPLKGHSIKRPWYHQELVSSPNFKGKLLLLPDVGKFEIELNAFDPALLANGIVSRYPSTIKLYKNRNRRINRYLVYIQYRMFKLQSNPHAYWCFTQTIIRLSHCYLVACLHSVDRNVYRTKTLKELRMLILRLNRMRGNFCTIGTDFGRQYLTTNNGKNGGITVSLMQHYLKFFRIYIPKGESSHRPLGVPTLAWRIFQKMWLPPLLVFTSDMLPDNFHGYIPQRGTGTAWREILKTVIHKQNIYEVDFKQFFPSVDSDFLLSFMLKKWNITLPVAIYLYQLNQSLPIFLESKSHDLIHGEVRFTPAHQVSLIENQAKILGSRQGDRKRLIPGLSAAGLEDMDPYFTETQLLTDYSQPMQPLTVNSNIFTEGNQFTYTPGNTAAWIEAQRVTPFDPNRQLRRELDLEFKGNIGLPQGGSLSPYLSILYLQEVLNHLDKPSDVEFLFYADDGIFYSDNKASLTNWLNKISSGKEECTLPYYNININKEKSGWVKVNGEWLTPLKFLGLQLVPSRDGKLSNFKLFAKTREGSNLEFGPGLQELVHFEYAQRLVLDPKASVIHRKLAALKSMPANPLTGTMTGYYEALLELHDSNLRPALFEYGYFIQKAVGTSINSFIHFLRLGIISLGRSWDNLLPDDQMTALNQYVSILTDNDEPYPEFKEIRFNLDGEDEETIFGEFLPELESILYSTKSVMKHQSASKQLLSLSGKLPTSEISSLFVPDLPSVSRLFSPTGFARSYLNVTEPHIEPSDVNPASSDPSQDINPHNFITLNTVLEPFRFLTLRMNQLLSPMYQMISVDRPKGVAPFEGARYMRVPLRLGLLRYYFRKYQFTNFVNSRYFGLIMSRLYMGSLSMADFNQDFEFGFVRESLAELLLKRGLYDPLMNIFTGSSYACHEMIRLSAQLSLQSKFESDFVGLFGSPGTHRRQHRPFRLFDQGPLAPDSW